MTSNEIKYVKLFNDFKDYLATAINNNIDVTDTGELKKIASRYLFTNRSDTSVQSEINFKKFDSDRLKNLKEAVNSFYIFLQQKEKIHLSQNLTVMPIRLSKDTFIYNRLISFQKANTLVFFDKRYPEKTLGYLLFIPQVKGVNAIPKIWAWTLVFEFGQFFFKAVTGEDGYEYVF